VEESASLAATRFLDWLIIAISPIAFFTGFFTVYHGVRGFRRPDVRIFVPGYDPREHERWDHSLLERVAVGLCAVLGVVLVLGVAVAIGQHSPPPLAWISILPMAVVSLLLTAPVLLWKTRYRVAGEGIATIALSVISMLAAISGGNPFFLGLLVIVVGLITWLCIAQHLRKNHPWETIGPRVDSSP